MENFCGICTANLGKAINCHHRYCDFCLLEWSKKSLSISCYEPIKCSQCDDTIDESLIYSVFGGKVQYCKYQNSQELFECPLCLNNTIIANSVSPDCYDMFCKPCFSSYLSLKIKTIDFDAQGITCPSCGIALEGSLIKESTDSDLYEKYIIDLTSIRTPKPPASRKRWCLICDRCCIINEFDILMYCSRCRKEYCSKCKLDPHGDCNSLDLEADRLREQAMEGLEDYEKTLELIKKECLKCPSCSEPFQKESGCNFIKCGWPRCKETYFCSLCLKILKVRYK
jgi:hypothetical protein